MKQTAEMDGVRTFVSLAVHILTLPREAVEIDAFVLIPGLISEDERIIQAITLWEENPEVDHFLIPVHIKDNPLILTIENLLKPPFNLRRTEGVICTPHGENTKIQAEWIARQVKTLGIESLIVFAAPFHMLRAYLTLLKTFLDRSLFHVLIIPSPTVVSPFRVILAPGYNTNS